MNKNDSKLINLHLKGFKFLIILLIACSSFIILLIYFNMSPVTFIKFMFEKFGIDSEYYDNTNLYYYSESIDESESIKSFLTNLHETDKLVTSELNIGTDVTENFLTYAGLAGDFSYLSKLVTTWDNKFLAFNNSKLFLFQILRDKIYLQSLSVPGVKKIEFAYIFKSGNILFCDNKNAYYSNDNLLTYHMSNVLDIDGKKYLANEHSNFFSLVIDGRQIINDKEIRVWGNYTNYGEWQPGVIRSEQVQVWYTIDEGKTIKSAYKFGDTNPKLVYRHIHAVNICPWDKTFWVQTGDGLNECHWIQGKYNWEEDSWSWDVKASGDQMSYSKSTGFVFHDNYVFWSDDSSEPKNHGIWKTPYSNLISKNIDASLFEKVLSTDKEIGWFIGNNEGFMLASQYFKSQDNKYKIFITDNGGLNWRILNTAFQVINIHPPNAFGNILGNYFINQDTFEAVHFWDWTPSIFVNSYLEKDKISKK